MGLIVRLAYLLVFIAVWGVAYSAAPHLGVFKPTHFDHDPVKYLPVVTQFVWPYISFGAMPIVVYALTRGRADLKNTTMSLVSIVLISTAVYILFPTAIVKPVIESDLDIGGSLLHIVHKTDTDLNCFPSLHVSVSMFCSFLLSRLRPSGRYWWWGWGIAVVLSTLYIRQHYFADVFGGLALAWLSAYAYKRSC